MTIQQKIEDYIESRQHYDEVHALSAKAHQVMKAKEYELVDEMLNTGTKAHSMDNGIGVSLRKQYNCSVTKENEEQIREWLMLTEGDDSDFVVEKVNKPALVDHLKTKGLEPEDAPEFLKLSTRPGLTLRGWKNREER